MEKWFGEQKCQGPDVLGVWRCQECHGCAGGRWGV